MIEQRTEIETGSERTNNPARPPMRHDFAARPLHRFSERMILTVFRHRTVAGAFALQTARDIYRGAVCMVVAGDVKRALLRAISDPLSKPPAGGKWRYWRYLPRELERHDGRSAADEAASVTTPASARGAPRNST